MSKATTPQGPLIGLSLAAILRDIAAIGKDRSGPGYKFRGIDDLYNALHPIFSAHGVVCTPLVKSIECSIVGQTQKGNNIYKSVVVAGYAFRAADGSVAEACVAGEGLDSSDKATGKAMSAAQKYCLVQTFLIPTADIADGEEYDPTVDPAEELKARREESAKQAVEHGAETGEPVKPTEHEEQKLEEKKAAAKAKKVKGKVVEPTPHNEEKPEPKKGEEKPEPKKDAEDNAHSNHIIAKVSTTGILGVRVGDLTLKQLTYLKDKWAVPHKEKIDSDPVRSHERDCVLKELRLRLLAEAK